MGTAVDQLKAIGPTSTIEEYNAANEALDTAVVNIKTAAGEVQAARAAELETAVQGFKDGVGTVSDETTLMGAVATVSASKHRAPLSTFASLVRSHHGWPYAGLHQHSAVVVARKECWVSVLGVGVGVI